MEMDKWKDPLTPKEEENTLGKRVACAHSMAFEGVEDLKVAIEQPQCVVECNKDMMADWYQLLYWMLVHELRECAPRDEVGRLKPTFVG